MPENTILIQQPFNGLSDDLAFGDQNPNTTREALNVRGIDPVNGRRRMAQRSGLSAYNTNVIETNASKKIQDLNHLIVDNRQVSYANITNGQEEVVWSLLTDQQENLIDVRVDRQGNAYFLDVANRITKVNKDGNICFSIAVPVPDSQHKCQRVWVDDQDGIYTGVHRGGDQESCRLWKFEGADDGSTYRQVFQIDVPYYVKAIRTFNDLMIVALDDDTHFRARLRAYSEIDSSEPQLEWEQVDNIPWLITDMSIHPVSGDIFISAASTEEVAGFGAWPDPEAQPPRAPNSARTWPTAVDQDPIELIRNQISESAAKQVWAWYKAEDIRAEDTASGRLEDGAEVLVWRDSSGNGRHLYANSGEGDSGPTLTFNGLGFKAAVKFNGTDQSMVSGKHMGAQIEMLESQRTFLPAYTGCVFNFFGLFQPVVETNIGTIIYQTNDTASGSTHFALYANRTEGNTGALAQAGAMSVFDDTLLGTIQATNGLSNHPEYYNWISGSNLLTDGSMLIHCTMNGNVSGSKRGLFRVNGLSGNNNLGVSNGDDGYDSAPFETRTGPTYLGKDGAAGTDYYHGEVSEMIFFHGNAIDTNTVTNLFAANTNNQFGFIEGISHGVGEDVEAYFVYKYGKQEAGLGASHPFIPDPASDIGGPPPDGSGDFNRILTGHGVVAKYSPEGRLVWATTEWDVSATRKGGFGYGLAVTESNLLFSIGKDINNTNDSVDLRRIVDSGSTFSHSGDAWETNIGAKIGDIASNSPAPVMDVDKFGNVYVAYKTASTNSVLAYTKDGTNILSYSPASAGLCVAVAVDDNIPDYGLAGITNNIAENIFLATEVGNSLNAYRSKLVKVASSTGSARTFKNVAVSDGRIITFEAGAAQATQIAGAPHFSTGTNTSPYVQSAVLFQKLYITDGERYRVYDPAASTNGTVSGYDATSCGQAPPRRRLIEAWRDRIVLARGPDDPHVWDMSAYGDPNNWDFFPPVPNVTMAISGTTDGGPGPCPDIINSMVPYSDDVLLFGGDHTIYALVNDPAQNGRFDLVSDITGMAFGRPWAKDPNGVLYFFGSRGGLYRMVPGGLPDRVSRHRIERRLQDIDLENVYIRLAYNYRDEGIHIFQCPFGVGGTSLKHWFYDIKNDAFWEDQFGTTSDTDSQPTSVWVIDGDEVSDRVLLFGCEDGFVRKWDEDSKNDETATAIDSYVTLGPLGGQIPGYETQFSGLTAVMGQTDDGGRYELFANEEPSTIGVSVREGVLVPGRNPPRWDRVTGPYCWLRLRNSALDQRWSLERAHIQAAPAGLARPRTVGS